MRCRPYAALERPSVHVVPVEAADGLSGVLVAIHLDESETTIRLESRLNHVAKVLEQRNHVIGGGIRGEVSDVAGGLVGGRLVDNHLVALHSVSGKVVVTERRRGGHSHGRHGLLLRNRGLTLLVCPVAADGTGTEPLAIHGAECLLGIGAVAECDEAITTGSAGFHVPHHTRLGHRAKYGEGLRKDFVIDLIGEITDEDMEVVGRVLLGCAGGGLVGPIDSDFLTPALVVNCQTCKVVSFYFSQVLRELPS